MISTLPTQEQDDQIAHSLGPDVVRIRMRDALDWADDRALYFYVILSDEAAKPERLHQIAKKVRQRLFDDLALLDLEHYAYVRFRSASEQAVIQEKLWD